MKKKADIAKLVKEARKSLGVDNQSQQELLRKARTRLGLTNEELAEALNVSQPTLRSYLAPESAGRFRKMGNTDKLLLREILAAYNKKR